MDTIKQLIAFFLKVAFAFLLAALVWFLVSLFFPQLSIRGAIPSGTGSSTDWLPSPRKYSSLFGKKVAVPDATTNLFVASLPYNGFNTRNNGQYTYSKYTYVTYTGSDGEILRTTTETPNRDVQLVTRGTDVGTAPTTAVPRQSPTALTTNRSLIVRNLSIYEGGHVYTDLSFVGEAKSTMFRDGKFPIVIVSQSGKVIGVSAAVATSNWTVPGWTRFTTKIYYTLPVNVPCTMVFEEALTDKEKIVRQPLRVPIAVTCN